MPKNNKATTPALEAEQARLDRKISLGRATTTDIKRNLAIRGELQRRFDAGQAVAAAV